MVYPPVSSIAVLRSAVRIAALRLRQTGALAFDRARAAWSHRAVRASAAGVAALILLSSARLVHHVYFDRSRLPDIAPFILFEPPTIGEVYGVRGEVLIQLAREYRRVVTYDEIPPVVRGAVLSAEDRKFASHAGVDYGALPRVTYKAAARSYAGWRRGDGMRLLLPQGGSTITQQLVRVYFLHDLTTRRDDDPLFHVGLSVPRLLAAVVGAPAANKLLRKLEEVRLALWLEEEMERHYGTRERAKREIFSRYASFIYLGSGRYGFGAASEYYFDRPLSSYTSADAGNAALLAGIAKSPRDYAPRPGDPRPRRRRDQILALMARNGYIGADLARRSQAEPVRVARHAVAKTEAPSAIGHVLDELEQRGGGRFAVEDLFQGKIRVRTSVDDRIQTIVNEAMEHGIALYEARHPRSRGLVQGSVVVLGNADGAVLAEVGGRQMYKLAHHRYSDYNRATDSRRQPGSAMKPLVYLAAFRRGWTLATIVHDEPIAVSLGTAGVKWIANYDAAFKGPIPVRQALAGSRNAAAVWTAREIGVGRVTATARDLGMHSRLQPYITTALGASEVQLLELANVYRAMASGLAAEPHIIDQVTDAFGGVVLYAAPRPARDIRSAELRMIQEGLRGVIRLPDGTAHSLDGGDFAIPVMGKTGTTNEFRDALFVGSTYGKQGITVAVRIGFDDNRSLGRKETGGRIAVPIFREILLRVYAQKLVGPVPQFPREIEEGISAYLAQRNAPPPDSGSNVVPQDAVPVGQERVEPSEREGASRPSAAEGRR